MKRLLFLILLVCQAGFATDFYSKVRLRDTTTSTSTSTGSLRVDGGMGVAGTSFFGGQMTLLMSAGPMLTIKDGGTAGTNADPYIRFMDTSTEMGYVGFPVSNSLNYYITNLKNGKLIFQADNTGVGEAIGSTGHWVFGRDSSSSIYVNNGIRLNHSAVSGKETGISMGVSDGALNLSGDTGTGSGANIQLYAGSHATAANEIRFRSNTTVNGKFTGGELQLNNPLQLAHSSTPSSPSAGYMKIYPKSDNRFYTLSSAGTESELLTTSSGVEARMNHLYNGNFNIWQRGTSTTIANGATKYLADRWYVLNQTGTNGVLTYSRVAGTSTGAKYGAQVQVTTAPTASQANAAVMIQVLENLDSLQLIGKTASFQVKVKALGNVNSVSLRFQYKTSEGKPDTNIGSLTTCAVNSSTFTTCEISGEALGTSMTNAGVVGVSININGASSGNGYDLNNGYIVEQAMVVIGAPPTEFKTKYQSFAEELAACQRYYEKSYDYATVPGTATYAGAINGSGSVGAFTALSSARPIFTISNRYIVPKRTTPTFTPYSPWSGLSGYIYNGTDGADYAPSVAAHGEKGVTVTQGNSEAGDEIYLHYDADAEI